MTTITLPRTETMQFLTDVVTAAGLLAHGRTDKGLAKRISEQAYGLLVEPVVEVVYQATPIEIEYELWQDDMPVARAMGKSAWAEINHYAAQYSQDGAVEIFKITRQSCNIQVQPKEDKQ